jgi:peptidoglycan hydrolase CwlO-like protein
MIKVYVFLFIMSIASAIGYGGYRYVTHLQETIGTLRENNVLLESANKASQDTINSMIANAERNAELQADLNNKLKKAEQRVGSLRNRLSKIDITREALADPADMEFRINRGTNRLRQRVLKETGGEVTNDSAPTTATQ